MARKKTPKVRVNVKASLSRRLREIRQELFGEHGGPELARRLNLPARTWYNYETGVTVPAEVLLGFIEQTGVNPTWLLNGDGPRYRQCESRSSPFGPDPGRIDQARSGRTGTFVARDRDRRPGKRLRAGVASEFVAIALYPLSELADPILDPGKAEGHVLAYRSWLPNPSETIGVRLTDEAMHPILPAGSIVAVDRSVTDPSKLHGQIVAARPNGKPMIRWLDVSGRHVILRPNQNGKEFPLIPIEYDPHDSQLVIGQVVWSWSRFAQQ